MRVATTGLIGLLLLAGSGRLHGQFAYSTNPGNSNTVTITGYTGVGGSVVVPQTIGTQTVSGIGDYAFYNSAVSSVTIPDTITNIGTGAFGDCYSLTNAATGNGVASLGDYAFYNCTNLNSAQLSTNLTGIGNYAFYWCQNLGSVLIPGGVTNIGMAAFEDAGLTNVNIPGSVVAIGDDAFAFCGELASLVLNNGIYTIGQSAFGSCGALASVNLPGSVAKIGNNAFQGCARLSGVAISVGVASIGNTAFSGDALNNVTIPASVTNIGIGAFQANSALTAIAVNGQNQYYSSANGVLFDKTQATLIEYPGGVGGTYAIPGSVTNIGSNAFYNCTNLASITIPGNVVAIGDYSFYGCSGLTSITIPGNVSSIGNYAFGNCSDLVSVTCDGNAPAAQATAFNGDAYATLYYFPCTSGWVSPFAGLKAVQTSQSQFLYATNYYTITITGYYGTCGSVVLPTNVNGMPVIAIGAKAFYGSPHLTSVTIPGSIINIGDYAFADCANLTNVTFTGTAPTVGSNVFLSDTNAVAYCLPCTGSWSNTFAGLPVAQWWQGDFGYQTNGLAATITGYTGNCKSITIPANINGLPVTSIGTNAFYFNTNLISVTIPAGITNIGNAAFQFCISLSRVILPQGVAGIGVAAFDGCTSLTNITLPPSVSSIAAAAFQFCFNLTTVAMSGNVTNIGDSAFNSCNGLTSIYFGGNAPAMGISPFHSDTAATAYYLPGASGWSNFSTVTGIPVLLWNPSIQTAAGNFGVSSNQFGFNVTGTKGITFLVAACTNLIKPVWTPLQSVTLTTNSYYFSDPQWSNFPTRFYELAFP
jgi:hypothetical protein